MFLKHTPRTPNLSPIVVNSCYIICFYLFDSIKSAFADINISGRDRFGTTYSKFGIIYEFYYEFE